MIIERVTITTTPISIKDIIDTTRGVTNTPAKCKTISYKYDLAETAVVQMSDAITTNKVIILDNDTEGLIDGSFDDFNIDKVFLSTISGTVDIDIVISQVLI